MVMCSEFQHDTLISRIAALHIIHWNNKSQILCFGQLVSHTPSIMDKLVGVLPSHDFSEMVYLCAFVCVCVKHVAIKRWINCNVVL
jgi:hypothetical protein